MSEDLNYIYKVIRKVLNIVLIIIGIYLGIKMAAFYMPFLIAFIISLMVEPAIKYLMKKAKMTRKMSSIIIFLIVFSIIIGSVTWGITALISESTNLLQTLNLYIDNPNIIFTSKDLEKYLDKTVKTIRSDLNHLVSLGLLDIVKINKRLRGYSRSKMFELKLEEIRGN